MRPNPFLYAVAQLLGLNSVGDCEQTREYPASWKNFQTNR